MAEVQVEENTKIRLQIWDTSGQEKFRSLSKSFYRGAQGVLLVFDLNSQDTFYKISYWMQSIKENSQTDVCTVLVGNKTDLEQLVPEKDILELCEHYKLQFFRTSAITGDGVKELFEHVGKETQKLFETLVNNFSFKQSEHASIIQNSFVENDTPKKKDGCC